MEKTKLIRTTQKESLLPKLHLLFNPESLSPRVGAYAILTKKHVYAFTSMIMVRFETNELFPEEFIEKIPSAMVAIHLPSWKIMCGSDVTALSWKKDSILVEKKTEDDNEENSILINTWTDPTGFPSLKAAMTEPKPEDRKPVKSICLNAININILSKVFGNQELIFSFTDPHRAVWVKPAYGPSTGVAIIMPVIHETW